MAARAWVLNLDADLELEKGAGYARARAIDRRMQSLVPRVRPRLLNDDDFLVAEGDATGLEGHAFCMTPSARRALEEAGAVPTPAPPVEVIRHVNHRRFCAELGQTLDGAIFATHEDEVEDALARMDSPLGVLLKRPFGFAGRGQRRVGQVLTDEDRAWLAATPMHEGVQVEPRVELLVETSVHAWLQPDGAIRHGDLVIQSCEAGAWQSSRAPHPGELTGPYRDEALAELHRVGRALAAAGYFGPFGVDGFVYRDERGETRHQLRSEINARHTMGWSLDVGSG